MGISRWVEQQVGVRLLRLHNAIYKGAHGRIGHRFLPTTPPNLLLHTTGAKTGQARSTSVAYSRDGGEPGAVVRLRLLPPVTIQVGPLSPPRSM
jgi:hypothetical protein